MTSAIVAPMCACTLWMSAIWWLLGGVRGWAYLRDPMPPEYFRVGQGPRPADRIVDIHHHFSNQFEILPQSPSMARPSPWPGGSSGSAWFTRQSS